MANYKWSVYNTVVTVTESISWYLQGTQAIEQSIEGFTELKRYPESGGFYNSGTRVVFNSSTPVGTVRYFVVGSTVLRKNVYKGNNMIDWYSGTWDGYENVSPKTEVGRGTYLNDVFSTDINGYPNNGVGGNYWYVFAGLANATPSLILDTTNARTLYEADVLTIAGTATDTDSGNVVNVKYQLNGGTTRAIIAQISAGVAIPFSKALTFKGGKLYDGIADITGTLAEGTSHTLKVWSEDDQGGKSAEQTRTFQVIANRPAVITVAPFTPTAGQIDSDAITISGTVSDPDGNSVVLKYKIGSGSLIDVYAGTGGPFSFAPKLSALAVGKNTVTIQATDSYGAVSTKTLQVTKAGSSTQLKTSTIRYKLTPPNGSAKGVVLWIQRETGDLAISAEISMGAAGAAENFVPMTKTVTAYVAEGLEEDEFTFEAPAVQADITLKLTVTRASTAATSGIKLISGVLS